MSRKLMNRDELREKYPEYDKLSAIEKIVIEDNENSRAGNFRKKFKVVDYIFAIGAPIALYLNSRNNINIPDPEIWQYMLAVPTGYLLGFAARIGLTTLVHETLDKEGELGSYLFKDKDKKNNS